MDPKWNPGRVAHPASAAVRITDLSWRGNLNPSPLIKDDGELLMDEYLSPRKLKVLTGVDDLLQVKALEMRVDTRENSMGNFGAYLPNMRELKLTNSLIVSVRDLGTTLSHLHVLWMARCGLSDLDGISSCSSLKELYIAYNNISDLSQLTWLDHLEVLDLKGNNIEDINQMHYLELCCGLSHLILEGNPICLKPNAKSAEEPDYIYRAEVKNLIPRLKYLDKIPTNQTAVLPSKKIHDEDWLIIKSSIKEGGLAGDIPQLDLYPGAEARQSGCIPRHLTTSRLGTTRWSANAGRTSNAHLLYSSSPLPDLTASDELLIEDDCSDLTHATCSEHFETLWSEDRKLQLWRRSAPGRCILRTEIMKYLQTDQREKAAQALKGAVSDEEEGEDCSLTDSCEDKLRETPDEDFIERISLDSSCHSCLDQSSSGDVFALGSDTCPFVDRCISNCRVL